MPNGFSGVNHTHFKPVSNVEVVDDVDIEDESENLNYLVGFFEKLGVK